MWAEIARGTSQDVDAAGVGCFRRVSDASPFEGSKLSGHGRELGERLLEFTQTKSVWVATSDEPIGDPFVLR